MATEASSPSPHPFPPHIPLQMCGRVPSCALATSQCPLPLGRFATLGTLMTQSRGSSVCGIVAETRQIHRDYQVLCRKRDSMATLSRGEHFRAPQPLCQEERAQTLTLTDFYWLNLHRNTGHIWKAHQSLSGSNFQIDNIQRTLRAYFESGSGS